MTTLNQAVQQAAEKIVGLVCQRSGCGGESCNMPEDCEAKSVLLNEIQAAILLKIQPVVSQAMIDAKRYQTLRPLNVSQFRTLYMEVASGHGDFDDLVDKLGLGLFKV